MYLKEQLYVMEIYKERSLSRAAENLHVTQPALSTFLSSLENMLGVPLFTRTGRGLLPTEAGELYATVARKMLRLQEQFYLELDPLLERARGTLRIGFQRLRGAHIAPLLIEYFAQYYPEMKLGLTKGTVRTLLTMLQNDEQDALLCYDMPGLFPAQSYDHIPILQDQFLLAAHKGTDIPTLDSAENSGWPVVDLGKCGEQSFILQHDHQTMGYFAGQAFRACGIHPSRVRIEDSVETALRLTGMGFGLSFTMESYLNYFHGMENIAFYRLPQGLVSPLFCLITKKDRGVN